MPQNIPAEEVCPLPPRPDLDFELDRAARITAACDGKIALSEAQFLVARSYGFASWEMLERYFVAWKLHSIGRAPQMHEVLHADGAVRQILLEFNNRAEMPIQPPDIIGTGAAISTYVPRFFGLNDAEIFGSSLSEAEAQLVVARRMRFDSWKVLKRAQTDYVPPPPPTPEQREKVKQNPGPITFATLVRGENDRERITNLFTDNQHMFAPISEHALDNWFTWRMVFVALGALPDRHEVLSWIRSLGIDMQRHLNIALLGSPLPSRNNADVTPILLELGADPNWLPANGFSVLEHALVRHGSGKSVDLIAQRVVPRKSFWIAAGLGDVATMNSYFEPNGNLSQSAHDDRPDFVALDNAQLSGTGRPNASEVHVMWEASMVAVLNSRTNTIGALLDRGLPPDYSPVWMNALHFCVDHNFEEVARLLLSRGANPDFKAWPDQQSPREMAKWFLQHDPDNQAAQLILKYGSN